MTERTNFSKQQPMAVSQLQNSVKELTLLLKDTLTMAREGYDELAPSTGGLTTGI